MEPLTGEEVLARDCATSLARLVAVGTLMHRAAQPKPQGYDLTVEAVYPCKCGQVVCTHDDRMEWSFPCTTVFEALDMIRTEYGDAQVHGYGPPMNLTYVSLKVHETGEELFRWTDTEAGARHAYSDAEDLTGLLDEWEQEHCTDDRDAFLIREIARHRAAM